MTLALTFRWNQHKSRENVNNFVPCQVSKPLCRRGFGAFFCVQKYHKRGEIYEASGGLYELIINIIRTMPASTFILVLAMLCMIAFYATSFDSIAYTSACYSYKKLGENEKSHMAITLPRCLLPIVLPIALVFSESSMNNIQSVGIISAFPIGIIMVLMIWNFVKDAKKYMVEKNIVVE